MSDSFLNLTGLRYYHDKILALFATKTEVGNKVDKVSGKGLSTNDYTTAEKNKLSGIATGAEVNVIESIKVNGTAQTITSKAVDISIPTKLSDLSNDGNFVTDASYVHTDNNYTAAEKSKLAAIEASADVNVIEAVKRNGVALTVTNKAVDISVPTALSELTNDGNFVTDASYVHTDNNYTTTEKNKLSNIAAGAEVNQNAFSNIKVGSTTVAADSKTDTVEFIGSGITITPDATNDTITFTVQATTVDSAMSSTSENPVQNKVINSALANKANLASPTFTGTPKAPTATAGTNTTQIATTQFVTTAVANAIAGVTSISYQVVASLPATGENGVIYLVAHSHGTGDGYDEYIWVGSSFEKLGNTDIDLSGYMLKTDMIAITTAEIDTLFA